MRFHLILFNLTKGVIMGMCNKCGHYHDSNESCPPTYGSAGHSCMVGGSPNLMPVLPLDKGQVV